MTTLSDITIDLCGHALTELPAEVLANRGVRHLRLGLLAIDAGPRGQDLATNQIRALPPEIEALVELRTLDLGGNPIADMPATLRLLARLPHLTDLNLQMTTMRRIPPEIALLRRLTTLSVGSNPLDTLGDDLGSLPSLRSLSAECCGLRALPREIGECRELEALYLFSNQLEELPPSMGELARLRSLNLQRNHLSRLPAELDRLRLRELTVAQNPFPAEEEARIRAVFGNRARFTW